MRPVHDRFPARRGFVLRAVFLLLVIGLVAAPGAAHEFELTQGLLLLRTDGTYQLDLRCDLDALALGVSPSVDSLELAMALSSLPPEEQDTAQERIRTFFERRTRIFFDESAVPPAFIHFPEYGTPLAESALIPSFFGVTARLEGRIPSTAGTVSVKLTRSLPPLQLTVLYEESLKGTRQLVEAGAESPPLPVHPAAEDDLARAPGEVAGQYLFLGFWHIIPEGLDHILFVLGLFLLAARLRPLVWQVTAFTAAHAVTLTLATLGIVQLPARIVEPLIALSIAGIALENVFTRELKPWRPAVVFAFGLLHGLGFAGVLGELGLPEQEFTTALVAFNVGIELGQLAVILLAFLILGPWRNRSWYRERLTVPLSLVIAAVGLYWTAERLLAG